LRLQLDNPNAFGIKVTSVTPTITRVRGANGTTSTSCTPQHLTVGRYAGSQPVNGKGRAFVDVSLRLSHGAPDACQNATFEFDYAGKAEQL
jgi:hypothetical protein